MEWLTDPQIWISLLTLTVLEIVLGIDNIIFISILAGKLPAHEQGKARSIGLTLALVMRVILLCSIFWLTRMINPIFPLPDGPPKADVIAAEHAAASHGHGDKKPAAADPAQVAKVAAAREAAKTAGAPVKAIHSIQRAIGHEFSWKDVVLLLGGLFLVWKSVKEIHHSLEGSDHEQSDKTASTLSSVILQICLIDIVFSLDSVITAVGLVSQIGVMIAAVVLAMGVMLVASKSISDFVNRHPTVKMLALSFLILIGVVLIGESCGQHIAKGYIYFALAFSVGTEMLNIRQRTKAKPVDLRSQY